MSDELMGPSKEEAGGALPVLFAVLIGGAGTMTVELAAVRLLAPWYGTSLSVWTNVIAVVLLALALGYAIGGRLSSRPHPFQRLGLALGCACLWTSLLPTIASRVAPAFVPDGLVLSAAADVVLWGSLATSLALFFVPAALLGAVTPLGVQAVQLRSGGSAGGAGGTVFAAGTLGSLVGVFGTSHFLLPNFGLRGTFLFAAMALGCASLVALFSKGMAGKTRAGGVLLLLTAVVLGFSVAPTPIAAAEGTTLLAARESPYQSLRIVEDTTYGPEPMRFLQVNEGLNSYQSVWQYDYGLLPKGFYYNDFALPLWWDRSRTDWEVLVLGLGGGTAFRVLQGAAPDDVELRLTGVELDQGVVDLAREFLDLEEDGPNLRVLAGMDARVVLEAYDEELDLVILDCYANQVEIPAHLATAEFFEAVAGKLRSGGWLLANLGGFGLDDPVVQAVAESAAFGFGGSVLLLRVPQARNLTLLARWDAPLPVDGSLHPIPVGGPLAARVAPLALPGAMALVPMPSGGPPLTDNHAPLEQLQMRSIREARERRLEGAGE